MKNLIYYLQFQFFSVLATASAATVFSQGSPLAGSRGAASTFNRIAADNFILNQDVSLNGAEVYLSVPEDSIDTLEFSVFFFDGAPGLNSTNFVEKIAQIDSYEVEYSIFPSLLSMYRINLSFDEIPLSGNKFLWFGLESNVNGALFALTEFPDGSDNIFIRTLGSVNGQPTENWDSFGDGSLAFSLSGDPVPEPSSLLLLLSGLPLALLRRRG